MLKNKKGGDKTSMFVNRADLSRDITNSIRKVKNELSMLNSNLHEYWNNDFADSHVSYTELYSEMKYLQKQYNDICKKHGF
jgi:septation ring formation regulator EzrA